MLLIDMNNLCMREAFAKAGLSHRGRPSGVIFGCLKQIRTLTARFPGEVCCCWDSPRETLLRRQFFPGYKVSRDGKETPPEVRDAGPQMKWLRESILPRIGLPNQMIQEGYEADDLIAVLNGHRLVHGVLWRVKQDKIGVQTINNIIVSSDNDLYQLLGPRTSIYNLGRKAVYTWRDFQVEFGLIGPAQWATAKAMAGDDGDDVPGVPGVGIKTAIKHIQGKTSGKIADRIIDHERQGIIQRNLRLVALPWSGCDPGPIRESHLDLGEFRRVCAEWGLGSLS